MYNKYYEEFISVLNGFKNIKKPIEHIKNFESVCSSIEELKEKSQSLVKRRKTTIITKPIIGNIESNTIRILMAISDVIYLLLIICLILVKIGRYAFERRQKFISYDQTVDRRLTKGSKQSNLFIPLCIVKYMLQRFY